MNLEVVCCIKLFNFNQRSKNRKVFIWAHWSKKKYIPIKYFKWSPMHSSVSVLCVSLCSWCIQAVKINLRYDKTISKSSELFLPAQQRFIKATRPIISRLVWENTLSYQPHHTYKPNEKVNTGRLKSLDETTDGISQTFSKLQQTSRPIKYG